MFNRVMLFAMLSMLILCLAGCGADDTKPAAQPAAAAQTIPRSAAPGSNLLEEVSTK